MSTNDPKAGDPLAFEQAFSGRNVLVTGHTGFTGGWLCTWLNRLGANVSGLALAPETTPDLYSAIALEQTVTSTIATIDTADNVTEAIEKAAPEIIFHLAAQPLVSRGYDDPAGTFQTNVIGTLHVLEAARNCAATKAVLCVTTDKVYRNNEWTWGYREIDRLGGKDPYSASKACAELVADCYRQTMIPRGNGLLLATARGGNIIGGGDWADNRIVPDFVRAVTSGGSLSLRHPQATRPWQHVLVLAHAYLLTGSRLLDGDTSAADAWNFGPINNDVYAVRDVVETLAKYWTRPDINYGTGTFVEAGLLQLDSSKALKALNWNPPWDFDTTIAMTAQWYRDYYNAPARAADITNGQVDAYRDALRKVTAAS